MKYIRHKQKSSLTESSHMQGALGLHIKDLNINVAYYSNTRIRQSHPLVVVTVGFK